MALQAFEDAGQWDWAVAVRGAACPMGGAKPYTETSGPPRCGGRGSGRRRSGREGGSKGSGGGGGSRDGRGGAAMGAATSMLLLFPVWVTLDPFTPTIRAAAAASAAAEGAGATAVAVTATTSSSRGDPCSRSALVWSGLGQCLRHTREGAVFGTGVG